ENSPAQAPRAESPGWSDPAAAVAAHRGAGFAGASAGGGEQEKRAPAMGPLMRPPVARKSLISFRLNSFLSAGIAGQRLDHHFVRSSLFSTGQPTSCRVGPPPNPPRKGEGH